MRAGKTIAVVCLVAALLLYRPVARWIVTPSAVRASWVEPVADARYFGFHAELPTFGEDPHKAYEHFDAVLQANEQKRRLYRAAQDHKGKFGLFRRYSTVEGDPIFTWLLVEDGRVTYVHDHTRDGGAAATAVDTHTPKTFKLGFMRDHKFIEGDPTPNDSQKVVLELDIGKYDKVYFH
jgi:hypothetical protein